MEMTQKIILLDKVIMLEKPFRNINADTLCKMHLGVLENHLQKIETRKTMQDY